MSRALVFPGQGAQYVGMGMALAEKHPAARAVLDQADRTLGFALSDIIHNGPEAELTRTDMCQPAILVVSVMALEALRQMHANLGRKLTFAAAAGLSLGEYTALVAAEALPFDQALKLARLRGQLMQAAADLVPSGMVALIGVDEAAGRKLCELVAEGDVLQVANLNAPGQVVVSGHKTACERAIARAREVGCRKAVALPVAGAFHSALMAPAAEKLRQALAKVQFRDPVVPIYTNVTAKPVTSAAEIPGLLERQLTMPVLWAASVVAMQQAGIGEFWELGPGKSLGGMIGRTVKDVQVKNLDTPEDALGFAAAVAAG